MYELACRPRACSCFRTAACSMQRLRGDTLTIPREDPAALKAAYSLPNGARATVMSVFLDAEPLLEVGNPDIVTLAHRLRGNDEDPRVVAERINKWVYDSVEKRM